jgi:hypothetical protein
MAKWIGVDFDGMLTKPKPEVGWHRRRPPWKNIKAMIEQVLSPRVALSPVDL